MKMFVLLLLLVIPEIAHSKAVPQPWRPKPIIIVDENSDEWTIWPQYDDDTIRL